MQFGFKVGLSVLALVGATSAWAFPIADAGTEGLSVIVSSADPVVATYQGNSASYSNDLYLNGSLIFNNHETAVGTTMDLGSFAVGTELIFELRVRDSGYSYFTGAASRNPDGHVHARVQQNWQPGVTLVSFEDLYNGSFDYNDLSFSFTNTQTNPVPEAPASLMLALGLGSLAGLRRLRAGRGSR